MRLNKIICFITAALLMLAVPAISDAAGKGKGKGPKGPKPPKPVENFNEFNCKTSGTWVNGDNVDALISAAGTFAAGSVGTCNAEHF